MPQQRLAEKSDSPLATIASARASRDAALTVALEIQEAASCQLLAAWPGDAGPMPSVSDIEFVMADLVTAIQAAYLTPAVVIHPRAQSELGRGLFAALRAKLVRDHAEAGESDVELMALLAACDRVRDAITAPPDAGKIFAGVSGMGLLVEVAHDLRSPLTSILFLAETMQRGQSGPVTEVQRRQLGLVYTAALGLSAVASDIIDLTRSEMLVEQKPLPFSIRGVLDAVQDIVRPIAEEKQLALRISAPAVDARLGHQVALSRVLLNLTTNALKFTNQGFVELRVHEVTPAQLEFSVIDSGRGIDAELIPTLFEPVRRAVASEDGHKPKMFSQTGLGLTICRKLLAIMGSELRVESQVGWGTRFYFELELPPCPSRATPSRSGDDGSASERRRRRAERRR